MSPRGPAERCGVSRSATAVEPRGQDRRRGRARIGTFR